MPDHFERPTTHQQEFPLARRITYLFVSAIIGVMSGVVGLAVIVRFYFPSDEFLKQYPIVRSQIDGTDSRSGSQESVLAMQGIIVRRTNSQDATPALPFEGIVGPAVALTSDGWFAFSGELQGAVESYELYVGSAHSAVRDRRYDSTFGVTFVKIETQAITPVDIVQLQERPGDLLFSNDRTSLDSSRFFATYVRDTRFAVDMTRPLLRTAGIFSEYFRPTNDSDALFYFDTIGRLVGVRSPRNSSLIIPARYLWLSFELILAHAKPSGLGISYYYAAEADPMRPEGITIANAARKPLDPRGLAAQAGLAIGDRILAINSETIGSDASFEYLWQTNQLKSQVSLLVDRNGKEFSVTITR